MVMNCSGKGDGTSLPWLLKNVLRRDLRKLLLKFLANSSLRLLLHAEGTLVDTVVVKYAVFVRMVVYLLHLWKIVIF